MKYDYNTVLITASDMWLAFVNPVMNFWVPWTVGNLLTRLGTSSVARKTARRIWLDS
jgi:hypothetical protein